MDKDISDLKKAYFNFVLSEGVMDEFASEPDVAHEALLYVTNFISINFY